MSCFNRGFTIATPALDNFSYLVDFAQNEDLILKALLGIKDPLLFIEEKGVEERGGMEGYRIRTIFFVALFSPTFK